MLLLRLDSFTNNNLRNINTMKKTFKQGDLIFHECGKKGRFIDQNDGFITVRVDGILECWNPENCKLDWISELEHFTDSVERKILDLFDGKLDKYTLKLAIGAIIYFLGMLTLSLFN